MKKAERKRVPLLATLGDLNRTLRVRPVRYMGREWWAVSAEDTWPGMVMDLRRLGFESVAMGDEVLVRESAPAYEPELDGPTLPGGLQPFPTVHPTIKIRRESYSPSYSYWDEVEEDFEDEDDEYDVDEEDDELDEVVDHTREHADLDSEL